MNWNTKFDKVFIETSVTNHELINRIKQNFSKNKIEFISKTPKPVRSGNLSSQEIDQSKRNLLIKNFSGEFFKRCPGARKGLACCNYFVLNLGSQCDMDCSYCYLQSFLNYPYTIIYANIQKGLDQLDEIYKDLKDQHVRVGTGEITDSLSLDPLSLYSKELIHFFKGKKKWKLEFKTKSDLVDQFLDEPHAGNVIVSFSVNPQNIVTSEEHGTASLESRLLAAQKSRSKGFPIAFHIDPIIWHEDWKKNYVTLVDKITSMFSPSDLPYISLGALRFQKGQRHTIRKRFPKASWVTSAEMFPGKDGKLRYDRSLREDMFQFIICEFKKRDPKWNIFLCMETPETWLGTYEKPPTQVEGLKDLFKPILSENGIASTY